ncbi:MAG: hypothetical protein Q7S74_03290 [Nanoarchaeota archaeon]|nr:hypothetical protein [Nanoarchaeota archaeon]
MALHIRPDEGEGEGEGDGEIQISNELVSSALQEGLYRVGANHPHLKPAYLHSLAEKHLDKGRLNEHLQKVVSHVAERKDWSNEERQRFIYENIANYVESEHVFDPIARRTLSAHGLEDELGGKYERTGDVERDQEIERTVAAASEISSNMDEGFVHRNPGFAKAVYSVNDLGVLYSALNVLTAYKVIDRKTADEGRERIHYQIKEHETEAGKTYQEHLYGEKKIKKIAAIVLGLLGGVLIVFSGSGITGNVVGASSGNVTGGMLGALFIALALVFVWGKSKNAS